MCAVEVAAELDTAKMDQMAPMLTNQGKNTTAATEAMAEMPRIFRRRPRIIIRHFTDTAALAAAVVEGVAQLGYQLTLDRNLSSAPEAPAATAAGAATAGTAAF